MSRPKPYKRPVRKRDEQRKRDWHDKTILVVEILGVVAIVATIVQSALNQAESGREMSAALNQMASIASSTAGQEGALIELADATADVAESTGNAAQAAQITASTSSSQSDNFRRQTTAIIAQTVAMTNSAQANIKAADATRASAEATSILAQAPTAKFGGIKIEGWDDKPNDKGWVEAKVKRFTNAGNVFLTSGKSRFKFSNYQHNTEIPDTESGFVSGVANEIQIAPNKGWGPKKPVTYLISPENVVAVNSGEKFIFICGHSLFFDNSGSHLFCFSYIVEFASKGASTTFLRAAGGSAYRCKST